ncbi:MAG: radical SAM protein, partial [Nanoarchaeota archaeon]|nr:radical SAM protein [Nanoarchaeota archaeon]
MIIREIQSKSIITKSELPESEYCLNPYIGCSHGCIYCYARFMKRFTGHSEPWGDFVDIKMNAPELARNSVKKIKKAGGVVLIGSVTDAYQPIEKKYQLTRNVLIELLKEDIPISILTKSALVTRDIDLLSQFSCCSVGLTI